MCSPVVKGLSIRYFIGRIDQENSVFIPDNEIPQRMNYGESGCTAPSGFVDPKTGRVIVFTLAHGGSGPGWSGNMGLPIEISLNSNNELVFSPIKELNSLRKRKLIGLNDLDIKTANEELKRVSGNMIEVLLEIETVSAKKYGIEVRKSPHGEEKTGIYFDVKTNTIGVDHSKSTLVSGVTDVYRRHFISKNPSGPLNLKGENLKLHVYIDKAMLEVYANNRKAISTRTYPSLDTSNGLELFADGELNVKSIQVWELNSIIL